MPTQPTSVLNDATVTDDMTIRFTWDVPVHDGGAPVIDYNIYYDQGLANG